ncbi:MAG: DUF308 domain-containing protein [Bacteroidales bacterium]|nr:DUF308 domain-containing protein [Bacteroidales bacterium]
MLRSVIRGLFVFLVGLCLVIWSTQAGEILLKALGVFLILSSVITVVYGLATNSYVDLKGMSLISIASAVLFLVVGLFLLLKTSFFMEFIGFVLGILLALYGLLQLVVSVRNSKGIKDRFWFFLVPALIFVAGIVFCFFPRYNISVLCIIFGICLMLLGASEIWMSIKVRALAKRLQAAAQAEAEQMKQNQQNIVVEAIEPDEPEYEPSEPETYAPEASEDIAETPEAEDETYAQEDLNEE